MSVRPEVVDVDLPDPGSQREAKERRAGPRGVAAPPGGRLRILFELPYAGYLRIYGSTIRALAERGHIVLLSYDKPAKRRDAEMLEVEKLAGVVRIDPIPWQRGVWTSLVRSLRLTADYARFLDPRFRDAPQLRRAMERYLPARSSFLVRVDGLGRLASRTLLGVLRTLERAIPSDRGVERHIQALDPDVVVVTPLVTRGDGGVQQTDVVKAARRLGLPVGVAITSWDHLSSKGLLRGDPDVVFVWNDAQKREARELHRVPAKKIVITGAQLFDQWFSMEATASREEFARRAGVEPALPYVLYVGSSKNIAPAEKEIAFVRGWVATLRKFDLVDVSLVIRPHPGNAAEWEKADVSDLERVVVFPRGRTSVPMTSKEEADYFHSLHYAAAVVGVNTSAMIEAAVVGRPVLTIKTEEFVDTQGGTVHFRYLLPGAGGPLQVAEDLRAHVVQLRSVLRRPEQLAGSDSRTRAFVSSFVRPRGLELPATQILADEIEALGRRGPGRRRGVPLGLQPLRLALWAVAVLTSARSARLERAWPPRRPFRGLLRRRPRFGSPFSAVTTGVEESAAEFERVASRRDRWRFVARRYWSVAKAAWRGLRRPPVRDIGAVSEIYEGHYDKANKAYAKARDKRRDVFMVGRKPVAADGWYTFKFHADLLARIVDRIDVESVLEVGSGRGTNIALLGLNRPHLRLTGLELTRNGVEQARALVRETPQQYGRLAGMKAVSPKRQSLLGQAQFVRGNAMKMPFEDKSFDFSFTCLVLEQMPDDYARILAEMRRVTRKYCAFIEPFRDANGLVGKACLRSSNYFRASYETFAEHGLEPVYFTTEFPQKVQFKTGLLIARVK